jgi:hypothetical protein
VAFRLLPREEKFYQDFQALADELRNGARLLEEMLAPARPVWDKADEIKEVEHKCDFLTHEVIQRLNRTFVTPIDREDIHALVKALDDVLDHLDAAAARLVLYKIPAPTPALKSATALLVQSAEAICRAAGLLGDLKNSAKILEICVEINRLENEADTLNRISIGNLFETEKDPIALMKWKEIYEVLEDATDRCEDVANVFEQIVLKSS